MKLRATSILLFAFLFWHDCIHAREILVQVDEVSLKLPSESVTLEKSPLGQIHAQSMKWIDDHFHFFLTKKGPFLGQISLFNGQLSLSTESQEFGLSLEKIPFLRNVHELWGENVTLTKAPHQSHGSLQAQLLELGLGHFGLRFQDADLYFETPDQVQLIDSFLNTASLPRTQIPALFSLDHPNVKLLLAFQGLQLSPSKARGDLEEMNLLLPRENSEIPYILNVKNAGWECVKDPWSLPLDWKHLTNLCLSKAHLYPGQDHPHAFSFSLKGPELALNSHLHDVAMTDEELAIDLFDFSLAKGPLHIGIGNLKLNCLKDPLQIPQWSGEDFKKCLNSARLSPQLVQGPIALQVVHPQLGLDFSLKYGEVSPKKFSLNLAQAKIKKAETTITMQGHPKRDLNVACSKGIFTLDMDPKDILVNCLSSSNISIPKIRVEHEKDQFGALVESEIINLEQDMLFFAGPKVEAFKEDNRIEVDNLSLYCHKDPFTKDSELISLALGCFKSSWLEVSKVRVCSKKGQDNCQKASQKLQEDEFDLEVMTRKIEISEEEFELIGDSISYQNPNSGLRFGKFDISCQNKGLVELIVESKKQGDSFRENPSALNKILRGCFESSQINIESVQFNNKEFDAHILLKQIKLDKGRIMLDIPRGSYIINDDRTQIQNAHLFCRPNAKIEDITALEWKNLLQNCLGDLHVSFSLMQFPDRPFYSNSTEYLKDFRFDVLGNNFQLTVSFDAPVPFSPEVRATALGTMNFDEKREKIILEIKNISLVGAITQYLPVSGLMKFILAHVFDEKYFERIDDDTYYIYLPRPDVPLETGHKVDRKGK